MKKLTTLAILTLSILTLGLPSAYAVNQYPVNHGNQGFVAVDEEPQTTTGNTDIVITMPTKGSHDEDDPCNDFLDGFESGDTSGWSNTAPAAPEAECELVDEEEEEEERSRTPAATLLLPHF